MTVKIKYKNMFEKYNNKENSKSKLYIILCLLVLGFGSTTIYFYRQFYNLKNNPQRIAEQEANAVVAEVAKLLVLPEGEIPTVATVADPEKLSGQVFFAKAKKGDKVLIYANARKAILYDPVAKKIVEVSPLNIGN